ncbi:MAG: thermostable hemolysin [Burkholderiales bacterium]|nr:thermostable hemolysin [Burkholderiales bacterium]
MLACLPSSAPPGRSTRDDDAAPAALRVHARGASDRAEVEVFIRAVYRERFGADVRHFAPVLVSLRDGESQLIAAAGYRAGGDEPLFLERYLEQPVHTRLSESGPHPVPRHRLVEVGHLAAARAGAGRALIALLGAHLAAQGFQWVVGTLTQELRHLFLRLGIAPVALGIADPAQLGDEAASWGTYYDHRPVVLAGNLELALHALARRRSAA